MRDYVHVDDVVSAYLRLSEVSQSKNLNGEAFNFSRDEPLSVLELYRQISITVTGKYVEPEIKNSAKSEIKDQHLSNRKAHSILGWKSSMNLQNGLEKTFNWYRTFLESK
jgi:CDP-glucose 4,6-dehydratase